jgi:hypothetical protein
MTEPKIIAFTANKHLKLVRDYAVLMELRARVAKLERAAAKRQQRPKPKGKHKVAGSRR